MVIREEEWRVGSRRKRDKKGDIERVRERDCDMESNQEGRKCERERERERERNKVDGRWESNVSVCMWIWIKKLISRYQSWIFTINFWTSFTSN